VLVTGSALSRKINSMKNNIVSIVIILSLVQLAIANENAQVIIEDINSRAMNQDSIIAVKYHKRKCNEYSEDYSKAKRSRTKGIVFLSLGAAFIGIGLLSSQHPNSEPSSKGNTLIFYPESFMSLLVIAGIPIAIVGTVFTIIGIPNEIVYKKMLKENGCEIPKRNKAN
jgi:hypothetical protein